MRRECRSVGPTTHPVGQKRLNGWGWFDTIGNVAEWCADWDGVVDSSRRERDPKGPDSGEWRIVFRRLLFLGHEFAMGGRAHPSRTGD
jgi:hypothetical protein